MSVQSNTFSLQLISFSGLFPRWEAFTAFCLFVSDSFDVLVVNSDWSAFFFSTLQRDQVLIQVFIKRCTLLSRAFQQTPGTEWCFSEFCLEIVLDGTVLFYNRSINRNFRSWATTITYKFSFTKDYFYYFVRSSTTAHLIGIGSRRFKNIIFSVPIRFRFEGDLKTAEVLSRLLPWAASSPNTGLQNVAALSFFPSYQNPAFLYTLISSKTSARERRIVPILSKNALKYIWSATGISWSVSFSEEF